MAMRMHQSNARGIAQVACPGLHQKYLETATGQPIAPYCSGSRQGNRKHNIDEKCTHYASCFDGLGGAPVRYRAHRPMEEVHGFPKSH